jgi:hypothetical protein
VVSVVLNFGWEMRKPRYITRWPVTKATYGSDDRQTANDFQFPWRGQGSSGVRPLAESVATVRGSRGSASAGTSLSSIDSVGARD